MYILTLTRVDINYNEVSKVDYTAYSRPNNTAYYDTAYIKISL